MSEFKSVGREFRRNFILISFYYCFVRSVRLSLRSPPMTAVLIITHKHNCFYYARFICFFHLSLAFASLIPSTSPRFATQQQLRGIDGAPIGSAHARISKLSICNILELPAPVYWLRVEMGCLHTYLLKSVNDAFGGRNVDNYNWRQLSVVQSWETTTEISMRVDSWICSELRIAADQADVLDNETSTRLPPTFKCSNGSYHWVVAVVE